MTFRRDVLTSHNLEPHRLHSHDLPRATAGAAGNFITEFGTATLFNAFYVYITNTIKGQGPNYVSGITITAAGTGYQPETPITLTGGGGTGALAVANTTPGTASSNLPAGIRSSARL